MIKLVETIQPKSSFHYPDTNQHMNFLGITILAPLPNQTTLQFDDDPITYPVEVIQGLKCNFSGFTLRNNDDTNALDLTIYLQTAHNEFLPEAHTLQTQVSINQSSSAAFSSYTVLSGTSSSTTPVILEADKPFNEADLLITGSNAMISVKYTSNKWGDWFKLLPGYYAYSISGYGIKFYAVDTSSAEPSTTIQLIGLM